MVALEPGRDIGEQRERGGVRFRETVVARNPRSGGRAVLRKFGRIAALAMPASSFPEVAEPPFLCQAPIARRNWSASPGVKPAATTASCMACSWKIGTRQVRASTSLQFRARSAAARRWHECARAASGRDAPCRPGSGRGGRSPPRRRDRRTHAAAGAAACSSAPAIRSGRRRRYRRDRSSRRWRCPRAGMSRLCRPNRSSARRAAESMPSASTSTFSRPSASMSFLSHWITVRSAIAAFSIGTSRASGRAAMTKPPTCWDRCRGKPTSISVSASHFDDARAVRIEADAGATGRQLVALVPPRQRAGEVHRSAP